MLCWRWWTETRGQIHMIRRLATWYARVPADCRLYPLKPLACRCCAKSSKKLPLRPPMLH